MRIRFTETPTQLDLDTYRFRVSSPDWWKHSRRGYQEAPGTFAVRHNWTSKNLDLFADADLSIGKSSGDSLYYHAVYHPTDDVFFDSEDQWHDLLCHMGEFFLGWDGSTAGGFNHYDGLPFYTLLRHRHRVDHFAGRIATACTRTDFFNVASDNQNELFYEYLADNSRPEEQLGLKYRQLHRSFSRCVIRGGSFVIRTSD